MARSGTTMLASALEALGVFMGWRQAYEREARFFVSLNDWLLGQSGGTWDHPEPFRLLLASEDVRALAVDYVRRLTRSPRAVAFLGPGRYLRFRALERLAEPWGWKDPRTTFTLPVWLDCFGAARVIHVCRHGVDVAESLRVRQREMLTAGKVRYLRWRRLYWLRPKRGGFTDSLRCSTLEAAFHLWDEYVTEARAHVVRLGAQAIEVRFEAYLDDPVTTLWRLKRFLELDASRSTVEAVAAHVVPSRAYAYRASRELSAFAERMAAPLVAAGY